MFTFHDFYLEKDLGDAVSGCQEIIRKLLTMLGDPGMNWEGLTAREAEVMVYVVKEVDGVPQFVVKDTMVNLVKGFGEIQIYCIHI